MDFETSQMRHLPHLVQPQEMHYSQMSAYNHAHRLENQNHSVSRAVEEAPVQMSPFHDDRWELDLEESRRRKEIHRDYVFNYRKHLKNPAPPMKQVAQDNAEPKPPVPAAPAAPCAMTIERSTEPRSPRTKVFDNMELAAILATKAEHKLEVPKPPNLYPVLKFPERSIRPFKNSRADIAFEKEKVCHYGVNVPFWQFTHKI